MPKQNWEERFEKEIICHCDDTCEDGLEGEKHTISNPEKIKSFISKLLSQTEQEVKNKILKSLPKITTHICRFNDGDCVCRCYESAINETKKAIANLK